MLFPSHIVDTIAKSAYWADRTIRSELIHGLIAHENDYTSNFTRAFRGQINARAIPNLKATSYVLKPSMEHRIGADGCIVLKNAKEFKICIFESKWPRWTTHKNYWDALQTSRKVPEISHFDSQLQRQSPFSTSFAIWEMFYSESEFETQQSFMPSHVSACVSHEDAFNASCARASNTIPWNDVELIALLSAHRSQIDDLIREVCNCRKGRLFSGQNYLHEFNDYGIPREILLIEYVFGEQESG